jgi:osmoprotectant transport system ATP-binding protein
VISFDHVTKTYDAATRPAVDGLTLDIPEGETVVIIGPSGCGKSTTLRMINRLIEPDSGTVTEDGQDVATLKPEELRRRMGYAIQGVGLFPHWTVAENIGVVPKLLGWEPTRTSQRVRELLELVGLEPESYTAKYPDELSGGEAQRVGVARALAADPPVLLMDEPFGALDALTRRNLQDELLRIWSGSGKSVLFVTHGIEESLYLADRVVVMTSRPGAVKEVIPVLLPRPRDPSSSEFGALSRRITALVMEEQARHQRDERGVLAG